MSQKQVKIAMITGYLGAGKTTLLNHILTNTEGIRAAVIVNDIGEVNIDADFIARSGSVTTMDESLIPMTNGCICCTLSEDLANQLREIANSGNFDYIIIEASGVCEPVPIAYTISAFCEEGEDGDAPMALDNIISVVDCARMFDEFNGGSDLVDEDAEEDDIVTLIIEQIEFCSTLILNKADAVTPEQLAELKAIVRGLQKDAKIIEAVRGDVDLADLLNTGRFDFENVYNSAVWVDAMTHPEEHNHAHDEHEAARKQGHEPGEGHEHEGHEHEGHGEHEHGHEHEGHGHDEDHNHDYEHHEHGPGCTCGHCHEDGHDHVAEFGITTFVYERRKPFKMQSLHYYVNHWPRNIIRAKGMIWFEEDPDNCVVFEQAGRQIYVTPNGKWVASATAKEREEILSENPHLLEDWDEEVGDRMIKLVIIGRNMDRGVIEACLDACLAD